MIETLAPALVVATGDRPIIVHQALSKHHDVPVVVPRRQEQPTVMGTGQDGNSIHIITVPADGNLTADTVYEQASSGLEPPAHWTDETAPHRVCVTTDLSLDVNPYERTADITGLKAYNDRLPDGWPPAPATHCSTALRPGFQTTAAAPSGYCSIVGLGESEAALGVGTDGTQQDVAVVDVYANGVVSSETVTPDEFGLRQLERVGEKRAKTLREAGYESVEDVAKASFAALSDLPGLGKRTVKAIKAAATAQLEGTVVSTDDDSLPRNDPIFVDIETDGLEPSTVWLIGVLDGNADDGRYMAFRESAPDDQMEHLEAFLTWLQANGRNRPLVAWNGYNFDFPALREQISTHFPDYLEAWDDWYLLDLLWWARDRNGGNAILPGRNNRLVPVATALGWESDTVGIDGQLTAEVYAEYRRAWLAADDPATVDEPDWDRLEAYCEDDVRALATIYEALADAARRRSNAATDTRDTGTQGALSDYS